jgi:hypothetical protein
MIGIIIPGNPVTRGGPITSNMVIFDVVEPKNINNIGLFLEEPIPDGYGASMYFSVSPFTDSQFLGCVANQRPSDVFYTGWSLNPEILQNTAIKVCVKLEELSVIKDSFGSKVKNDINQEFAKRIAKNLFNFLDSYNKNQDPNQDLLVVPLTSLQNWYDKFLVRYNVDPNFLFKCD